MQIARVEQIARVSFFLKNQQATMSIQDRKIGIIFSFIGWDKL
jgi:hypothetical protein